MDVRNTEQCDAGASASADDIHHMEPADVNKTAQLASSAGANDILHMDSADVRNTEQRNPGSSAGADDMLHMDPETVKKHFDRIGRFRVLVIGRSNAGKTTLLQRVCNTTELPEVCNAKGEKLDPTIVNGSLERGDHDIENELVFRSNPRFVFHDSRGFESGSVSELELMKKFIANRGMEKQLAERIHAIWFCIPMSESERAVVAAEERFFNECNTEHVPVIVLLTKADAMEGKAIGQLIDRGMEMKEAILNAGSLAAQILSEASTKIKNQLKECKYKPKEYLPLGGMNNEVADCDPLIRCTTNALDDIELQKLVVSAQQVNFQLNIEFGVKQVMAHAREKEFNQRLLELEILQWMPFNQVINSLHLGAPFTKAHYDT
ncbi:hypothetical protein SCLCIDRAFT_1220101 [Scleroderma citrinum Foug A]|uniref:G domain-containing protein n=1 Tax=Scleroderma citrinum Foug A TaxID=1036808 RepID=A0A0C3DK34_9AGAM|nr:hypothetical protein SCLCIDRAFT_1220101 [Scleroderma citrinum Foug A]